MVPPKVVMELKSLPEDTLSATVAVKEALQTKYTKFSPGPHAEMMNHLVKTKLTLNLSRLNQQLREELLQFLGTEFPPCDDWTPVKVQPVALRVVARMTGRTFVGPDLCRTEQWMDTSINFAVHVFAAVIKLQFFPDWLRPLAQYLVSELGQLRRDKAIATSLLRPVIEERLRDADVPGYEKPDDYIQWLLDALPEEQRTDFEKQAELQLILAAASIHTTNNLLTECIFDLAAHPDVQEELRLEAEEVLESRTENGADGWDCKDSMARLKKMDSFIKECQRTSGNVSK